MTRNDAQALLEQWALWSRCDMQSIDYKKQSAFCLSKSSLGCSINDDAGRYIDKCISSLERDHANAIRFYFLFGLSQDNAAKKMRMGRKKFLVVLWQSVDQFIDRYKGE
jgi:hypothetical protein